MTAPFHGTASIGEAFHIFAHWDDLQATESQGAGGAALTYADFRDTQFSLYSMAASGTDDELHFRYQMPHAWDPTTEVRFHLHAVPLADPAAAQKVQVEGYYCWALANQAIPAEADWTTFTVLLPVAVGDVNKHKIYSVFSATPPAGAHESAVLLIYLKRNNAATADTYTGALGILSVDVHFQRAKMGTRDEYPAGI